MTELPEQNPDQAELIEVIENHPFSDERSLARRTALQILYELDCTDHPLGHVLTTQLQNEPVDRNVRRYARQLVLGVDAHRVLLDDTIRHFASSWPLEQMAIIDRNILRIAVYEFAISGRVPTGVAIDEAVELAKVFGAESATGFVNGVLGALARDAALLESLRAAAATTDQTEDAPTDESDEEDS
ncbi:MAG: transcription antitermination factor NusB [Chloroflexi bacterium]|nr:transcription antitermination factor NusB [Chloroflexota bacterium]